MQVELKVWSIESGVTPKDAKFNPGKPYLTAILMDNDPGEAKLSAFLKWNGEGAKQLKPNQIVSFGMTGLGPAKNDKSAYYLRGDVVSSK